MKKALANIAGTAALAAAVVALACVVGGPQPRHSHALRVASTLPHGTTPSAAPSPPAPPPGRD